MSDPPGYAGGILTERELLACLGLLATLEEPACASVALTWDIDTQNAWILLCRAGYATTEPVERRTSFAWARILATPAGRLWREQILRARATPPAAPVNLRHTQL